MLKFNWGLCKKNLKISKG